MSVWFRMFRIVSLFSSLLVCVIAKDKSDVIQLNEETWPQILEGEWLVKFYAPWCPACRAIAPIWNDVAGWSDDLDINVAEIDVSQNPGLSGRFLVTSLPTLFHVKNGKFRVYRGQRSENEIISFVDDKKWKEIEPVPWYISPTAIHMSALGLFFKASMGIRDLHSKMTTDYGIPVWGSYAIFAVATIIVGLLLGLLIVFLCDCMLPNNPPETFYQRTKLPPPGYRPVLPDDEDKDSDIVVDDLPKSGPTPQTSEQPPSADLTGQDEKPAARLSDDSEGEEGTQSEEELSEDDKDEDNRKTSQEATGGDVPRPKSARRRKLKATTD